MHFFKKLIDTSFFCSIHSFDLIFKVLLQLSITYIILELKIYTNTIVKYNSYIDTTKTLKSMRIARY